MKKIFRPTFHNSLSYVGAVVFLFNVGFIIFLTIVQMLAKHPRPHADIVIFIILPFFSGLGLVLVIIGMVRERRRMKAGVDEQGKAHRKSWEWKWTSPRPLGCSIGQGKQEGKEGSRGIPNFRLSSNEKPNLLFA